MWNQEKRFLCSCQRWLYFRGIPMMSSRAVWLRLEGTQNMRYCHNKHCLLFSVSMPKIWFVLGITSRRKSSLNLKTVQDGKSLPVSSAVCPSIQVLQLLSSISSSSFCLHFFSLKNTLLGNILLSKGMYKLHVEWAIFPKMCSNFTSFSIYPFSSSF